MRAIAALFVLLASGAGTGCAAGSSAPAAPPTGDVPPVTTLVYDLVLGTDESTLVRTVEETELDGRPVVIETSRYETGALHMMERVVAERPSLVPISSLMQPDGYGAFRDLRNEDGHTVGNITVSGGEYRRVEQVIPEDGIFPGMLHLALRYADLSVGAVITRSVVGWRGGSGSALFEVVDTATVTVPAGEFEAFVVDVTTGDGGMRMWLTRAAPHVVVKQENLDVIAIQELREWRTGATSRRPGRQP